MTAGLRNVLVSGGSRGLGLAIAETLAQSGFRVIAVARQEGDAFAAACARVAPGALRFHACDLAEIDALPGLMRSLRASFGPLYGLVNNAAMSDAGLLSTVPDARLDRLVRLNVLSPLVLTKYAVRSMMAAADGGRIVNIASVVAATGYAGIAAYSASKSALVGLTRSLARELGPLDITVNAVAPGFVDTEMTGGLEAADRARILRRSALGRAPEPGDIAAAVAYLFGAGARNVTGTVLTVDAGNTA